MSLTEAVARIGQRCRRPVPLVRSLKNESSATQTVVRCSTVMAWASPHVVPPLRCRGGRQACSRPVRPGLDAAPDRGELGLSRTTVSDQLRRAGVTTRRGRPLAHPTSIQQILELRDQGLTWREVADRSI
jgi:hypothetical protein